MNRYEVEITTKDKELRWTFAELERAKKAYHNAKYSYGPDAQEIALHDLEAGETLLSSTNPYRVVVDYDTGPHSAFSNPMEHGESKEHTTRFPGEKEAKEYFDFLCHIVDLGISVTMFFGTKELDGCTLTDMP